ncbi:MAG: 50S ribosomal protein L9 [Chloroflexaceae bacterium]|nr:50S ribosomal protein L9 [Chloroflexaceae bacterium]
MKVLLVQDVEKLGRAGEVKDVSGGYGRNFLIPKGMAVLATRGQVRQAQERIQAQQRREDAARHQAESVANRLGGTTLRFQARVGELDRLYGSVTSADIATRLHEQFDVEIDRRKIDLDEPIKRTGVYPIKVHLGLQVTTMINVMVEAEGQPDGAAPETTSDNPVTEADQSPEVSPVASDTADDDLPADPEQEEQP